MTDPADGAPPDAPEDPEAARRRAERAVRGAFAATLLLEALSVLFVPRAIAPFGSGLTAARLALLLSLAALLAAAAFLQRHRAGLVLGTVLQGCLVATGALVGAMYVVGALFLGVWVFLLYGRSRVLRVPRA